MGVAAFGRLRPYHFCRVAVQREPVPSVTRWIDMFAGLSAGNRQRNTMARKSQSNGNGHTVAEDVASIEREIGQLMHDIEARVGRLNALARKNVKDAASDAGEYVSDTVSDAADRVRNGASMMSDEAARMGGDAIKRIEDEVGQRPLLTLAIAAGIGFLAGMAGRRH